MNFLQYLARFLWEQATVHVFELVCRFCCGPSFESHSFPANTTWMDTHAKAHPYTHTTAKKICRDKMFLFYIPPCDVELIWKGLFYSPVLFIDASIRRMLSQTILVVLLGLTAVWIGLLPSSLVVIDSSALDSCFKNKKLPNSIMHCFLRGNCLYFFINNKTR